MGIVAKYRVQKIKKHHESQNLYWNTKTPHVP